MVQQSKSKQHNNYQTQERTDKNKDNHKQGQIWETGQQ